MRRNSTAAKSAGSGGVRPDKAKWEQVSPKKEMANNVFSKDSPLGASEGFPYCCSGADTKRTVAVQTVDLWGWLTTSTTADGSHSDVSPRKRCSSGAPFNKNYWWNSKGSSVAHSRTSGPDP